MLNIKLTGDGAIEIGANTHLAEGVLLSSYTGCEIIIGKSCRIARNVTMLTHNSYADQDFSKDFDVDLGDIRIGDFVWIGVNVFIKQGVTIGDNVVVGANSIVTKDIPDNCKYFGTKILSKRFP